jgi:hypothetical protein
MKKMFIVALIVASALVACGGKKKADNTMKGSDNGSAMGSDMGSGSGSDMGGGGSGSGS